MRLTNTTNIPDDKVRELIAFSKPTNVTKFDVMIKNFQYAGCRGRAYTQGSSYHYSNAPFIVVSICKSENIYPFETNPKKGGYLPHISKSREEHLLFVLAHELRHLWQVKVPKGWRVWGSKGKFSERDADAYAIRKVREYRQLHPDKTLF
jgi:hypothetical protein